MPNEISLRALALVLLLTFAPLPHAQTDPASSPEGNETGDPGADTPAPGRATSGEESSPGDESGPEPFVPTEKISADSAISFPVDI